MAAAPRSQSQSSAANHPPNRRDLLAMLRDEGVTVRLADDLNAAEKRSRSQSRGQQLQHRRRQSTNRILMVAPSAFEANIQAAADNHFMAGTDTVADSDDAARRRVLREYAGLVRVLTHDVGLEARWSVVAPNLNSIDP